MSLVTTKEKSERLKTLNRGTGMFVHPEGPGYTRFHILKVEEIAKKLGLSERVERDYINNPYGFLFNHKQQTRLQKMLGLGHSYKNKTRFEFSILEHSDTSELLEIPEETFFTLRTLDIYHLEVPSEGGRYVLLGQIIIARNGWEIDPLEYEAKFEKIIKEKVFEIL